MRCHSPRPEDTHRIAGALGAALGGRGLVLGLSGPLGAGKTAFVRGLAEAVGTPVELVASPTFVIAHEYPARELACFAHLDLYRVGSEAELDATGYLDWLRPDGLLAVEWSDRLPEALPADRLELRIERGEAEGDRVLEASAGGPRSQAVLADWRAALEQARHEGVS